MKYEPWPKLSYEAIKPTLHLLHMMAQAMGKLKLTEPFEPHWDGVPLWLTSYGMTTGPISYCFGAYSIDMDLINHQVICHTTLGQEEKFELKSTSVAALTSNFFKALKSLNISIKINQLPSEIPDPIPFDQDTSVQQYDAMLAQQWWTIMMSTQRVMQRHHSRFLGRTPPIGLMWGTLDLRDVRYRGTPLKVPPKTDFIRRNGMDDAQIEIGWWCGSAAYPRPAFFSYTFPAPPGIEQAKISPASARFDKTLKEFIYDYDDLLKSNNKDDDLLSFFSSTYQAGAERANWNPDLIASGKPL
jgi:hypothetical protein